MLLGKVSRSGRSPSRRKDVAAGVDLGTLQVRSLRVEGLPSAVEEESAVVTLLAGGATVVKKESKEATVEAMGGATWDECARLGIEWVGEGIGRVRMNGAELS